MISMIIMRLKARRNRRTLSMIREGMAFYGMDISDMSDEDLITGVTEYAKVCEEMTLSFEDAATAFADVQPAMQEQARFWLGIYDADEVEL